MPALNLNRGLVDLNRGSNSLNSISEQDTVVATCNMGKLQNNFSEMKGRTKNKFIPHYSGSHCRLERFFQCKNSSPFVNGNFFNYQFNIKKVSVCHKLRFLNTYVFANRYCSI